ncbi:spermatogenesis-associated protein 31A6-like [Fukomys damarensis]|uniref:spermatogenesis-associated protein 31A6-like n=1 Tax=Fukomys damarensis TaxID=885580 RepID=UPI001455B45E|nr:spermatogenesis-associated protein 31A6-like [Fukomys damarensis]
MQAWALLPTPERTLRAQLPENITAIQMMKNLLIPLKSLSATWLSPSTTTFAVYMILAFVCGLGLFLLLLPWLEGEPSLPPSRRNRKIRKRPGLISWKKRRRKRTGALRDCQTSRRFDKTLTSLLKSLERLLPDPGSSQQPGYQNRPADARTRAPVAAPQPYGDNADPAALSLAEAAPCALTQHLPPWASSPSPGPPETSCDFVCLPTSLTASQTPDPLLSPAPAPSCLEPRSPPQSQRLPVGQTQTWTHPQSSPLVLLAPYVAFNRGCETSCFTPHNNPPSLIPTEIQHPGRPLSKKHLEHRWADPSAVRSPQEDHRPCTRDLRQALSSGKNWSNTFRSGSFNTSGTCSAIQESELWEKLEQHIQKWFIQHQRDLLCRIQESPEVTQPQCGLAHSSQVKDKPGPSHLLVSTGECSKDVQKVRFQLRRDSGKNLGHILGKVPKAVSGALGSSPAKVLGETSEASERNLMRPMENDTAHDSFGSTDKKYLGGVLEAHLGVKVGQIHEGLIPLKVRRSWLTASSAFSTSKTHMETRSPVSSRSQESCVSTVQKFFFNPRIQQGLEMHITRLRVRRRWGLPLKLLKAMNVFKSAKALPSAFPQFARPSSSGGVSWAGLTVEDDAKFLGKPRQRCPGEEATVRQAVPTLGSLLVSSLSGKETERTLPGIPLGHGQGSSEAPLTRQESRGLSQELTYSLVGRTSESRTSQRVGRGSPEVPLLPGTCVAQDAREPGLWADTVSQVQHRVEIKSVSHSEVCVSGVHLPDSSTDSLCASDCLGSVVSPCPHHSMPLGHMLASQRPGAITADRGNSLGQQKLSFLKHQHSPKSQSKTLIPAARHEVGRRPSSGKHEDRLGAVGTSEPTQDGRIGDTTESERLQLLPQNKPGPSEGYFQRSMKKFLQCFLPKTVKRQGDTQKIGKPVPATVQSQRPAINRPRADHDTDKAELLVRAVGHMLEAKMMLQRELCAMMLNQREEGQAPISQASRCSEHRRKPGHAASPECHSCPARERHPRDQESLKTGQLNSEQQRWRHLHPFFPIKSGSPGSPSQWGPTVSRALGHQHYCPRHGLWRSVLTGQQKHFCPVFLGRKTHDQ